MTIASDPVRVLEASATSIWGDTEVEFLNRLGGATLILIPGRDPGRTRALCTLLHGNEPSGTRALFRFLKEGHQPQVNLACFVPAVETAMHEQLFLHRYMPGERDMNRCFRPPFNDRPGAIAERILQLLAEHRPECVIDIHNTSGAGPAFGVVTYEDRQHEALVSLFTEHLVVNDLRLGALMELSRPDCPIITIETGGAGDPRSDRIAYEGLLRYASMDKVLDLPPGQHLELYHNPARLEFTDGATLAYDTRPVPGVDLTVPPDLERYNFGTAPAGTFIGWLDGCESRARISARDGAGVERLDDWFQVREGRLETTQPLKLFMITHRKDIALSDCLLYAAPETEHRSINS
ncbi:hypothetical protein GCM10011352_02060 [Marinobacterium zhoushanense]|uniref:Succinylglutamate desuccinylase/Aspartoacylase catalytic domain-containing protein n=1 Tax=Marinobacterium zhoushanense TaxID=1679163 RepID=A0ABQ1K132_9GAMM|nr:succinylglutamate desuccinylase/aspartoacylase family protein [Marinobacterium zhoushanense]GGB79960.1 hypothetical protein GCM10011352_02060 [Marinobacterium zhoushanense]